MHTTPRARVYLHPAASTNLGAVRAIEAATGRRAIIGTAARCVRLLTPAEFRGGAA